MISVDQEHKSSPLQMDLILPEETTEPEKYLAWIHRAFWMFNPVKKFVLMSPLSASDFSIPLLSASDCSRILPSTLILPKKDLVLDGNITFSNFIKKCGTL